LTPISGGTTEPPSSGGTTEAPIPGGISTTTSDRTFGETGAATPVSSVLLAYSLNEPCPAGGAEGVQMLAMEVAQAKVVANAIGCSLAAVTDNVGNVGRLSGTCVVTAADGIRRLGDRRLTGTEKVHFVGNVVTNKDATDVANDVQTGVPNVDPESVMATPGVLVTVTSTTEMPLDRAWLPWLILSCNVCLCLALCGCCTAKLWKKKKPASSNPAPSAIV